MDRRKEEMMLPIENVDYGNTVFEFKIKPQREIYYNDESCYGVYSFLTTDNIPECARVMSDPYCSIDDEAVNVGCMAGKVQQLVLGTEYCVRARLEYNNKYRQYQYNPISVSADLPKTPEEQAMFLRALVTEKQADSILSVYPNFVEDIIKNKSIDCSKLYGIGDVTLERIRNKIFDNYVLSDIISWLVPYGVTSNMIMSLYQSEPNPVILKQKLNNNPYILTKINGFGFKRVDGLALRINPDLKKSRYRTEEFIKYYFNNIGNDEGNTYVKETDLYDAVVDNIHECCDIYKNIIKESRNTDNLSKNLISVIDDKDIPYVCLTKNLIQELNIVKLLKDLDKAESPMQLNVEKGIEIAEKRQGFEYTDEQKENIRNICKHNVSFVSGLAGCGKTTIIRGVLETYRESNCIISCCALSAKAAQRIREATHFDASTIHSLLGYKEEHFEVNKDNPLISNVIVLDEASMVNVYIFYSLLSAIKLGSRVIIIGDDGQLPPIGYGNTFHDLLNCDMFYRCKLTKIMRQAEKSGIISDSKKIRENVNPLDIPQLKVVTGELKDMTYMFRDSRESMRDLAIKQYLKAIEQSSIDDTIIITPRKKENITNSTSEINKILQDILVPKDRESITYQDKTFRLGAKVIQRKNNNKKQILNGDIGYVVDIDKNGISAKIVVDFGNKEVELTSSDLKDLELAYALTCHVTQGSGYENVIILIDNCHYKLLDSCLLYTAITRAIKKCLLIAEPTAFMRCINYKASDRKTITGLLNRCGLLEKFVNKLA